MPARQLTALLTCNLIIFIVGPAIFGLLPVYTTRLGADPALTGNFLAFAFLALTAGTIVSGRLSDKLQSRKGLLIASGVVCVPLTWLMGQAADIGQLAVLTAAVWFFLGAAATMVVIMAGLSAGEAKRGQVFGILGVSTNLGIFIGGLVAGPIVDRAGFPALFTACALAFILLPLVGLFVNDPKAPTTQSEAASAPTGVPLITRAFVLLFLASIIGQLANTSSTLARPLMMNGLHFDAAAISSAGAIGGAINLPLPLLVGWLSDRFGRKLLLGLLYFTSVIGMGILMAATATWHYWLSAGLLGAVGASMTVGSALVTDVLPREALGRMLSLFSATTWIAFVIGLAGTGEAIKALGMPTTLAIGALLPLIAILLLIPLRQGAPVLAAQNT